MAVKLLWYLTSPDGPYPWLESGRWDTDYEHLQQIAITADRLGFYGSLMGTSFGMDKKQRIQTFASGSSHAMTLMAVDLDANGKPKKWMVENSWGPGANNGHLIMTDEWFNEYMFRLVVETKYASSKIQEILKQKPIRLPAWDPMFVGEE